MPNYNAGLLRPGVEQLRPWESPAHTITGEDTLGSGAQSIADPRVTCKSRPNLFGVADWEQPISTISGSVSVSGSNAVGAVADSRLLWRNGWKPHNGTMGVQAWQRLAGTVTGGDVQSSTAAVADPRIPADNERPDPPPVIIALDGTWHRPLTTLELAVLQGFPVVMPDGRPLTLAGKSDARWRERVGNAVPPPTAEAIGEEILLSFLASIAKDEWRLSSAGIWVNYIEGPRSALEMN